jgi:chemotaxis protein MotB
VSASAGSRRGRVTRRDEHADERWLLTYSDMITLLMALFIVMWSISSVNVSKFDQLKASLRSAFSGKIVQANTSVLSGQTAPFSQAGTPVALPRADSAMPASIAPRIAQQLDQAAAKHELDELRRVRAQIQAYAQKHGFAQRVRTSIDERGLVVQLLTDEIAFDTGRADLKSKALPLLTKIASLIARPGFVNPVRVEGNTDSQPVQGGGPFRSNWELSTARADAVLQFLLSRGVTPKRLSVAGYADQRPLATNKTAAGRALNRRVNLVVVRRYGQDQGV